MKSHFDRGLQLFDLGWYAAARWEWRQSLPQARSDPAVLARTFNAMATALLAEGEVRQAYVRAELARDAASQLAGDHPQRFYADLNAALAAFRLGDMETARNLADQALRSQARVMPWRVAQSMLVLAALAIEGEQYAVADAWLARVAEADLTQAAPAFRRSHAVDRAICAAALGHDADAEAWFAAALTEADVDLANIYSERGWSRLLRGDHHAARADAGAAVDALLSQPAFLGPLHVADSLMLLSALYESCGQAAEGARLYMRAFAWMVTSGRRGNLRRSTRAALRVPPGPPDLQPPAWQSLVVVSDASLREEHWGPASPQRFGRTVHAVGRHFATRIPTAVLAAAGVFWRLPASARGPAALPARVVVQRLEGRRGRRRAYDAGVLRVLDAYDRALADRRAPYPDVLEEMQRSAGKLWDARAVRALVAAHVP